MYTFIMSYFKFNWNKVKKKKNSIVKYFVNE